MPLPWRSIPLVHLIFFNSFVSIGESKPFENLLYLYDYRNPQLLEFSGGDVICCRIDSHMLARVYGAEHTMLATSSIQVIHLVAGENSGHFSEDIFTNLTQYEYTNCRVANEQYDAVMFARGATFRSPSESIKAARACLSFSEEVYFNLVGCNCQHWVTEWRYGKAWSVQTLQPPNPSCNLTDQFGSAQSGAMAYSKGGQVGAMASGTVGKQIMGSHFGSARILLPSAEAYVEAGKYYTGAGFKASLLETKLAVGTNIAVQLGGNLDTEAGIGLDGTSAKLFGNGISLSRSKGLNFCAFGFCITIG